MFGPRPLRRARLCQTSSRRKPGSILLLFLLFTEQNQNGFQLLLERRSFSVDEE